MTQDFIPRKEADQVIWFGNFQTNIVTQGPTVGVSQQKVSDTVASCANVVAAVNLVEARKTALCEAVASKNLVLYNELKAIRKTASQIKSNAGYDLSIGQTLGIIGGGTAFDAASFRPEIIAENCGSFVRIKFAKNGADGVNIYSRPKGEVAWKFLARDTKSPYDDHIVPEMPGQSERWEYRAYGVIDDFQIGLPSEVAKVVYGE